MFGGRNPGFKTTSGYRGLIRHEYGHFLMEKGLTDKQLAKWKRIYNKQKKANLNSGIRKGVSEYADFDQYEGFAESFAAFTTPTYGLSADRRLPKSIESFFVELFVKGNI